MMESSGEPSGEPSRSGSPESLASSELGNIDLSDEDEIGLYEDLEQTIAFDLETLTDSGSTVNQLELEHQKAWREYVKVKDDGLKQLQVLKKKLQTSIDKTEPFVVVWRRARDLQEQAHAAALRFERAHSEYESAKETLRIAEEGIANLEQERRKSPEPDGNMARAKSPGFQIDEAWQETLANATERVAKTGQTRLECGIEHRRLTVEFQKCQADFKAMEARLKRTIKKSKPYYEARHICNQRLIEIKRRIEDLDKKLSEHKRVYKSTMKHLESLSHLMHDHKERHRSQSVMLAANSEPNLAMPRPQTPDFPLTMARMAFTPDVRKKNVISNIGFNFKGNTGAYPKVQPSKASANVVETCSSPELRQRSVNSIVSSCLSKALERVEDGENKEDATVVDNHSDHGDSNHGDKNGNHGDVCNDITICVTSDEPVEITPTSQSELEEPEVNLTKSNKGVSNGGMSNEGMSNEGVSNEGVSNEGVSNEGVSNEAVSNEGLSNEAVSNEGLSNEGVSNEGVSNEGMSNEGLSNEGVSNEGVSNESKTQDDSVIEHENNLTNDEMVGNNSNSELNHSDVRNTETPPTNESSLSQVSNHINSGSPGVSHSNKSSPGVSHSNKSSPGVSHSNKSSPVVSHSSKSSPGVSHSNKNSPGLTHSTTSSPGLYNITY